MTRSLVSALDDKAYADNQMYDATEAFGLDIEQGSVMVTAVLIGIEVEDNALSWLHKNRVRVWQQI